MYTTDISTSRHNLNGKVPMWIADESNGEDTDEEYHVEPLPWLDPLEID